MLKTLALLLIPLLSFAQNSIKPSYVSLSETKVFDVEIIIFAYNKALPNYQTYTNTPIFDYSSAVILEEKDTTLELFIEETSQEEGLSIPIDENKNHKQALVWFDHVSDDYKLKQVWEKLQNKNTITPIVHRAWRQAETPFESPQSVQVNTVDLSNIDDLGEILYPEYSLTGILTLSKGRFLHFGHNLNLFKQYQQDDEVKNMVFSLTERRQLYADELHYYDSPWIGSIVKITEVTGKIEDE